MTTLLTKQAFFFYCDNKILSLHSGRVLSLLKSAQLITCYVCYWKFVQSDFKIFRPINKTLPVSTFLCHTLLTLSRGCSPSLSKADLFKSM